MFNREHSSCAAEATLNLVSYEEDAVFVAHLPQRPEEARRRNHEAALALYRLDDDSCHLVRRNISDEHALKLLDAVLRSRLWRQVHAIRVGEWRPVDLGRKRPEAVFIGLHLGGHGHGR